MVPVRHLSENLGLDPLPSRAARFAQMARRCIRCSSAYSTTWIAAAVPLDRFYADRLRLVEAYDRAGFYGYHVAEHHATPLGVAPSPGVWLAAVAQRTKRLRFGPLVYLLPLYHPLKLLEEICMLDQMSGGRMLLGVGRGISPIELRYYGIDPDARRRCTPRRWR